MRGDTVSRGPIREEDTDEADLAVAIEAYGLAVTRMIERDTREN